MNERIKILRKNLGLTLEDFGRKLGVTKTTISRIENGVNSVTEQMFTSICREYSVNETWLRTGAGEMFMDISMDEQIAAWMGDIMAADPDSFRRRYVTALSKFNDSDWKTMEKLFKAMASEI